MILMLNGPFGVGKTTIATLLQARIPDSLLFDPEEVGFMLRAMLPREVLTERERTGDFQDIALWPGMVVEVAWRVSAQYRRHLIVPMTICNADYFRTIREGFRACDPETPHFCLTASCETIHTRLTARGDTPGSWPFLQTKRCLKAFREQPEVFAKIVDTEGVSVEAVCAGILRELCL